MPVECLTRGIFTFESDIWSFGVFLWELASLGEPPFADVDSSNELIRRITNGERLRKPARCQPRFYELMSECWSSPFELRPGTDDLLEEFNNMIRKRQGPFTGNMQQ
ncbi:tyrosine-protein kinase receptor Tie-1-like [Ptychodera flava]|uniref:tyrosine-protein kinase receptor Tie-1-like n=1 Tax=Ptychodera flava TaxID=63121 RepID=UPI00396A83C6